MPQLNLTEEDARRIAMHLRGYRSHLIYAADRAMTGREREEGHAKAEDVTRLLAKLRGE